MKKVLIIFFLVVKSVSAQDIKADLTRIADNYGSKEFTAKINYVFFSNGKKIEEASALHIQNGAEYYFKIKDFEIVNTGKCHVIVNHFFQSISVLPAGQKNEYKEMTRLPIDSALKDVTTYSYSAEGNEMGKYVVELKKGKYSKVELYFYKNTYKLHKLRLHISKSFAETDIDFANGIMEVAYDLYDKSISKENKKLLSENKFIAIKSGKATLSPAFKNYELNDYLTVKPE